MSALSHRGQTELFKYVVFERLVEIQPRSRPAWRLAVEGGETRVWAVRDKADPDKIATAAIPAEVIARFG
jgi:hypothetical protein